MTTNTLESIADADGSPFRFVEAARQLLPELVSVRRELHAIPEVGLDLPTTQQVIVDKLHGLPLEITLGERCSSVVAVLRGGLPGPTVLLRGDMDALPVPEETGLEFASSNGNMHGCGHDLHMASLIGAARLLCNVRDRLPGSVVFMFQPGEEGWSGAKVMLEEGLLDVTGQRPIAAYGTHVFSARPFGEVAMRPGPAQAGSNHLDITVRGRGGHGSMPNSTIDPVPVLAEIIVALQSYVTRRVDVFDRVVLSVTQLAAGHVINAIPDDASLRATVRTLSESTTAQLERDLPELASAVARAHGATADTTFTRLYPVTVNDPERTRRAYDVLSGVLPDDSVALLDDPVMGSEDFSFVLEQVPGTFVFMGAGPADAATAEAAPTNHSPRAVFDDSMLDREAAVLAVLAADALQQARSAETSIG